MIELDNEVLFLPQYFSQQINEADIDALNDHIGNGQQIYLHFGGKNEKG